VILKNSKCKEELTDENTIKTNKKTYHIQCKKDMDDLHKVAEIYWKYYNEKESWAIMMRSLLNWYNKHTPEYMLFCISKAVREKRRMTNFLSLYYLLNDLNYMERYKNKDIKYFNYDKVIMTEIEYAELLNFMGNNETKLNYYIRKLNDYMTTTNKSYDSHSDTIRTWYGRDEDSKPIIYKETIL